jgi:hypothetical protein
MNASTLAAAPTTEPGTIRTRDRKIFLGTAALLIAVAAVGLVLGAGGGTAEAPTTGAVVPATDAGSHVTPDHIVQPR